MKKNMAICWRLSLLVLILLTFSYKITDVYASSEKETLVFLTWADYMDPDLIKRFEEKFNTKLKQVYFESDEQREQKLALTSGQGYDLVVVSGAYVAAHTKRQWIAPLDFSQIPNIQHIAPRWRTAFPKTENYTVPYFWGTIGITYRKDLVSGEVNSWKQLFQPDESLRGKIGMFNDSKEVIGIALKALNYSINSKDRKELTEAEKLLITQKPFVKMYSTGDLVPKKVMVEGKVWMGMAYNGEALLLQERHPEIRFVVPEEGTGLWVDYLAVMQSSKKKELAMAFINFLNTPKNAAQLASFLNYATPNHAAEKFMPPEYLKNPLIYPNQEVLAKSEFFKKLSPRSERKRNLIFSKIVH